MEWQFAIVGAIVFTAMGLTVYRIIEFFRVPASKCSGCSGCKLEELKKEMGRGM